MNDTCKNYERCPIYSGILKDKTVTAEGYRQTYCDAGEEGWLKCKRYIVKEKTGKCPPNLLPNSMKQVAEIIAGME